MPIIQAVQKIVSEYRKTFSVIAALVVIFFAALFVNQLAVPNLLSHDQLLYELVLLHKAEPQLFPRDALFADEGFRVYYMPFAPILQAINERTGGSEYTYRLFVPLVFFALASAMFLLLYFERVPWLISLGIAFVSTILLRVLMDYWGVPGPSNMVTRFLVLPLYPLIFLTLYKQVRKFWTLPLLFLVIGFIGNIHQVSAFNMALMLGIGALLTYGFTKKNILQLCAGFVLFVIALSPVFITKILLYPADPLTVNDEAYIEALDIAHSHLTPSGMAGVYREFFITNGVTVWPLIIVFFFVLFFHRKRGEIEERDVWSRNLFWAVVLITLGTTLINQLVLRVLHQKTYFVYEPRAFQLIYPILYLYVGIAGRDLWGRIRNQGVKKMKMRLTVLFLGLGIIGGSILITRFQYIQTLISHKADPHRPEVTCSATPLYDWVLRETNADALFLIDPNGYPAFRLCAKRSVVYTYRDAPAAIQTNYLVEWAKRKKEVEAAYDAGGGALYAVAQKFSAEYIVSKACTPITGAKEVYRHPDYPEDCIYLTHAGENFK